MLHFLILLFLQQSKRNYITGYSITPTARMLTEAHELTGSYRPTFQIRKSERQNNVYFGGMSSRARVVLECIDRVGNINI